MRETVEAMGVEKLAEKKASLNPPLIMGQKIPSALPPYNEKLTMTELPAYCTKKRVEKVKSSHLYLYSAFNNTNCNKALHNIKIGKLCQ